MSAKKEVQSKTSKVDAMLKDGKTPASIAAATGCSKGLVYARRSKLGMAGKSAAKKPVGETPKPTKKGRRYKVTASPAAKAPRTTANLRQVGGSHYKDMEIQPWDAMKEWMTPEEFRGFLKGNAIKYLARANSSGKPDDLRKAEHYMEKLAEVGG